MRMSECSPNKKGAYLLYCRNVVGRTTGTAPDKFKGGLEQDIKKSRIRTKPKVIVDNFRRDNVESDVAKRCNWMQSMILVRCSLIPLGSRAHHLSIVAEIDGNVMCQPTR